jgi:predicted RNA-binding protein (virulence factor B family)
MPRPRSQDRRKADAAVVRTRKRARTISVPHADLVGRTTLLRIARVGVAGAFLAPDPADDARDDPSRPAILLPKREVPNDAQIGDEVSVFVTLDSEDRPLATTRMPALQLGEVAFLRVTAVTPVGAFVDWGLPKELMVPFREQTRDLAVGERHPVGLFVDKTGRLAGSMRVTEMLRAKPVVRAGEWVAGEAWRTDPAIGLFVIVERRFVGLVPKSEPHGLERGASAMFRVTRVRPDGRFELSLRAMAHEEMADDAAHVLAVLQGDRALAVGDRSTPDEIRTRFGLSKKAFKRAVGRLLKDGAVTLDTGGIVRIKSSRPAPTKAR